MSRKNEGFSNARRSGDPNTDLIWANAVTGGIANEQTRSAFDNIRRLGYCMD